MPDDDAGSSVERREVEAAFRQYLAVLGDLEKVTEMRVEHDSQAGWTCTFELSDGWSGEYRYLGSFSVADDDPSR